MFGLDSDIIRDIQNIFVQYLQIEKVVLYGSRAKGNYRNGSDIDLTICGDDLSLDLIYEIRDKIDELYLPYMFDISIFSHIDNKDLIEHIARVGKVFYQRKRIE